LGVTIKQIAETVGVSAATVSRALNGLPGVGPRVRKRIASEAARRGYSPDAHARALVTGRVPFLALVVPDITNPFFPAVARGAEEEAALRGCSLLLVDTGDRPERLEHALDLLSSRRVAGLVLAVPAANGQAARIAGRVVMAGVDAPPRSRVPVVGVDDRLGGRLVGRHLAALGRRSLAFVSGPARDRSSRLRLAGLRDEIPRDLLGPVSHGRWTVESGREQGRALFRSSSPPDAIFAANDLLAIGVAQAASDAGLAVGRDVALVGYDDVEVAGLASVPLTTVSQPKLELGRVAARTLLDAIDGLDTPLPALLEPRLVVRRSCGSAPDFATREVP